MTPDPGAEVAAFAYYLPQFYPLELNSTWWGEGFTEWNSVLRAHRGWRSPESTLTAPSELGFYDLRAPHTRERQGELAALAGLSALCVYHYYSAGSRLLPEVEDAIMADGKPDFPFFFGWANHDWTLAWKGRPQDVIVKQEYDEHLNDDHITRIVDSFADSRYFMVNGRHVVLVYNPLQVPEYLAVFRKWRQFAASRGYGLYLVGAAARLGVPAAEAAGLDCWVQGTGETFAVPSRVAQARASLRTPARALRHYRHRDRFFPYSELLDKLNKDYFRYPEGTIPLVISGWNNTGRRTRRASYTDVTPGGLSEAIRRAVAVAPPQGEGDGARRLVAINAWNEWGEGMTLEPSVQWGRQMIEACARSLGHVT